MKYKDNILITGGSGYIGQELINFIKKDYEIFIVDTRAKNTKNSIRGKFNSNRVIKFIKKKKIKNIIHLAAKTNVIMGEKYKSLYLKNNFLDLKNFCKKIKTNKIIINKFIFASSAAVYKSANNFISEKSVLRPISIYGKSKLMAEKFLFQNKGNFKNTIVLRFFNVAGGKSFFKLNKKTLFHNLYYSLQNKKKFIVYGDSFNTIDGFSVRDFIYIKDLSYIIKKLLEKNTKKNYDIFNISGGFPTSILNIINQIKNEYKNFSYKICKPRKSEIGSSKASNSKIIKFIKLNKLKDPIKKIIKDIKLSE